jgi:hypothetical protein
VKAIPYLDFDLSFQREEGGYRARADSPAGQAAVTFSFPFSDLELENFLLRVGRTRQVTRRVDSPEVMAAKAFGERLFSAVFAGEVRGCLRSSIEEARRRGGGVRIRLHLADAPELTDLPWEYLYNPTLNRLLGLSIETPVVRYLDLPERIEPLLVTPPLRVLVMISSPVDYPELDAEREFANLHDALGELEQRGQVSIERLPEASLSALQRRLRQGNFHVFHFVGHGGFDQAAQDGILVLEGDAKHGRPVSGQDLGLLLHDHRPLRLAVLNACEGARTSRTDPFAGAAQSLVQQGLGAVIAMQFEITDEAAIVFAREFYGAVADGYPVDAAVAEARKTIFAQDNRLEWGTPVLYLRAPDGRIFDVQAPPSPEPAARTQASLSPTELSVEPGAVVDFALAIRNPGSAPGRYLIEVTGIDPSWIRLPTDSLSVDARDQKLLRLTIAPPRSPETRAGSYKVYARVSSTESHESVTAAAELTVKPFLDYALSLAPAQWWNRAGRFVLAIENRGNVAVAFGLSARDRNDACRYELESPTVTVQPAGSIRVPLRVQPKEQTSGGAKSYAFAVTASPEGYADRAQSVSAQFIPGPALSRQAAVALLAASVAMLLAAAAVWFFIQAPVIDSFAAEPAEVTQGAKTALRWRVHNTDAVQITDALEPSLDLESRDQTGVITITPTTRGSHKFLLVARHGGRSARQTVSVTVKYRRPEIRVFEASPPSAGRHEVVLKWEVIDATSVKIQPEPGTVAAKGELQLKVPQGVQTARYSLTASNPDSDAIERSVVLGFKPAGAPLEVRQFDARPAEITIGQQTVLSWNVPGAEAISISGLSGQRGSTGSVSVHPQRTGNIVYTLTATKARSSATRTVEVLVHPPRATPAAGALVVSRPSIDFGAQPLGTKAKPQTITLRNPGPGPVTVQPIVIGGDRSDFTLDDPCSKTTLAAGHTCTLTIGFVPTVAASRNASLTLSPGAPASPQTVSLRGTGTPASVSSARIVGRVAPSRLNFGSQPIRATNKDKVVFENGGPVPLSITSVTIAGPSQTDFAAADFPTAASCYGTTLAPGSGCAMTISFTPTVEGVRNATLVITVGGQSYKVLLTGIGGAGAPAAGTLVMTPTSLDFGVVYVNTKSKAQTATLRNPGPGPATVQQIALGGDRDFTVDDPCSKTTIAAGSTCTLTVSFTPSAAESRSASLTLIPGAPGSPQTVSLRGMGISPAVGTLAVTPTSLNFGLVYVYTKSKAQTITLSNSGPGPVTIKQVVLSGDRTSYVVDDRCHGTTLEAGSNCTVSVSLSPQTLGNHSATLMITTNAPGIPRSVSLEGTGFKVVPGKGIVTE